MVNNIVVERHMPDGNFSNYLSNNGAVVNAHS